MKIAIHFSSELILNMRLTLFKHTQIDKGEGVYQPTDSPQVYYKKFWFGFNHSHMMCVTSVFSWQPRDDAHALLL
jgi:hypothetical protein